MGSFKTAVNFILYSWLCVSVQGGSHAQSTAFPTVRLHAVTNYTQERRKMKNNTWLLQPNEQFWIDLNELQGQRTCCLYEYISVLYWTCSRKQELDNAGTIHLLFRNILFSPNFQQWKVFCYKITEPCLQNTKCLHIIHMAKFVHRNLNYIYLYF